MGMNEHIFMLIIWVSWSGSDRPSTIIKSRVWGENVTSFLSRSNPRLQMEGDT